MLHGISIHCPGSVRPPTIESVIHARRIVKQIKLFDHEFDEELQYWDDNYYGWIQQPSQPTIQRRLI